ncbi:hypothetical protein EUTSA_v10015331mg [Eutrema salsugineum]|uniref:F-box/LRR-repeat protein 15/At3g58940/PEG3-like LRR domain-containing protein n=1 Tax=Eutrema salsugineum TaxID=72664 RepID=V4LK02_EUTSA|nr:hypothetical protein EUTSA_v10015331mg [Eutrema salsugineum]
MWVPKLEYEITGYKPKPALRAFIDKNMPLHKAPVIESFHLKCSFKSFQPEDINHWLGIAVSLYVRELSIEYRSFSYDPDVLLPSSLYTCESLVTLKLKGMIVVDVPRMVSLPSLKTLHLRDVRYVNEDSLRLLLSYCPVLEDLVIEVDGTENVKAIVVIVPSLQRLSLQIGSGCSSDGYVIVTPSLKYFKVEDDRDQFSYLIEDMPKLEEADINVYDDLQRLFEAITSVKCLSLHRFFNSEEETA